MRGEILVDAGRSRSTYHGHHSYIHEHCLRYRHNYSLFYQLLNSNLSTHRMRSFKREASCENYSPGVNARVIDDEDDATSPPPTPARIDTARSTSTPPTDNDNPAASPTHEDE